MRLTALDIKKKEFQQKMRGADPDEVQAFLNEISQEVETLAREKSELENTLRTTNEKLEHYVGLESTLEKTLVAAQQTAMKMEEQAKREAELILRDAELEKIRRLTDVRVEHERSERDLFRLRAEYEATFHRMKSAIAGFTSFVASFEQDQKSAVDQKPAIEQTAAIDQKPPIPQNLMPTASPLLPAPMPDGAVQWSETGTTPEPPAL
jgi:cell division initiation protein